MPGTPEDPSSTTGSGTALAFDVGTRLIGVAVGNRVSATARPIAAVAAGDWPRFDALVAEWQPQDLVVGLPLALDGGEQPMSRRARAFAEELRRRYARAVDLVDERNTSREAARRFAAQRASGAARRKDAAVIDALAAQIILENWLAGAHARGRAS
ncbi:MAG: Holliday junction resolvase RuvX [Dokdonella sp.]|uniref:Holliday junction resolvase RuvX n=1 Tax=Dokdonella sp. TaxID=2291710 RepID=UPI003F8080B7